MSPLQAYTWCLYFDASVYIEVKADKFLCAGAHNYTWQSADLEL